LYHEHYKPSEGLHQPMVSKLNNVCLMYSSAIYTLEYETPDTV